MHRTRRSLTRRDGWTAERQLRFLGALADSRCVRSAAAIAGMSRESAYRLRNRSPDSLFALLWDRALESALHVPAEGHSDTLTDGQLARLLGNLFRRKSGDFSRTRSIRNDVGGK